MAKKGNSSAHGDEALVPTLVRCPHCEKPEFLSNSKERMLSHNVTAHKKIVKPNDNRAKQERVCFVCGICFYKKHMKDGHQSTCRGYKMMIMMKSQEEHDVVSSKFKSNGIEKQQEQ